MSSYAELVAAFLEEQGHTTTMEPTDLSGVTIIRFRTRGLWYRTMTDEDDRQYYSVSCTMGIPTLLEAGASVLQALFRVQARFKCVKLALRDKDTAVEASVELILADETGFRETLWRAVSIIESALREAVRSVRVTSEAQFAAYNFLEDVSNGGLR